MKSVSPASSSCAPLTWGPPILSVTSSPACANQLVRNVTLSAPNAVADHTVALKIPATTVIDGRMRAKLEPACDIGNLIVPVDPQQIRASRMPKRAAGPFGARTGTDGRYRGPSGRAGNNRALIACASARDRASGTQRAVCNPTARQDALPIAAAFADFGGRSSTLGRDGSGLPGRGCL